MTVNCVLVGHNFIHEMQVISQIFFSGYAFKFVNIVPPEGYAVLGRLDNKTCTGELYLDGNKISACTMPYENKRSLMLAIFRVLKEATGQPTPWGALTGVRPAKQVRIWLDEGQSEAEITNRLSQEYMLREDKIKLAIAVAHAEKKLKNKPGTGIYVGIPFCPSRCLYCSFVVAQKAGADAHLRYLDALAKECANLPNDNVNTVYIGGGTPTTFSAKDFERLLQIAAPFANNVEYTVEAGRPDSISIEKLHLMKDYGVNRIAINPQTLCDTTLERIGRAHTSKNFYKAYEMAQQIGFNNINTDIIVGLPGESIEDIQNTMAGLKEINPPHITVHTLAIKRASFLKERQAISSDFGTIDIMLSIASNACADMGLLPYYMYRQKNTLGHFENVGWAKPGYESLYNVAMMAETQTVFAAGAGAVTKILEGDLITRKFNPKNIEIYIERMNTQ